MIGLLLVIHIGLASLSLMLAGAVAYTAYQRQIKDLKVRVNYMWISTICTTISGLVVAIGLAVPMGRVCVTMLVMLSFIYGAHLYQSRVVKLSNVHAKLQ